MDVRLFVEELKELKIDTIVGVPDSALKGFCNYVNEEECSGFCHYVPANEGAAVGVAIGNYLATGNPACVYMQNSGLGNAVNPITSLANEKVYDIPMLLLIGWRGQPEKKDEPQHKFMGEVTLSMLEVLDIPYEIINASTTGEELKEIFSRADKCLKGNKQYALVAESATFEYDSKSAYQNKYSIIRESAIQKILSNLSETDIVVSTTGKISREVYEQSDAMYGNHTRCFMTVGGMGHASMIAFGLAKKNPQKRVICIEGDGAILMHMGSMAFLGKEQPDNLIHICLNNEAHESVGGMPTGAVPEFWKQAKELGYKEACVIENEEELDTKLAAVFSNHGLEFCEIKVAMDSRKDLGRPKESAIENKEVFMEYIR